MEYIDPLSIEKELFLIRFLENVSKLLEDMAMADKFLLLLNL
jgi:hypothetical protein